MAWYSALISPIDKIADSIGNAFDKNFTTDEEKRKADNARLQIYASIEAAKTGALLEFERLHNAEMANLREVIKLELASEDAFVRRARPLGCYVVYAIWFINYGVLPMLHSFGIGTGASEIPWEANGMMMSIVGHYQYQRGKDKERETQSVPISAILAGLKK